MFWSNVAPSSARISTSHTVIRGHLDYENTRNYILLRKVGIGLPIDTDSITSQKEVASCIYVMPLPSDLQVKKSFWRSKWRWWCSRAARMLVWSTESEYTTENISSSRFATLLARQRTQYVTPHTAHLILPNPERSFWRAESKPQTRTEAVMRADWAKCTNY